MWLVAAATHRTKATGCQQRVHLLKHMLQGVMLTLSYAPQASQLVDTFRQFKAREAAGLADLYANKLAALEDALLSAREEMFAAGEVGGVSGHLVCGVWLHVPYARVRVGAGEVVLADDRGASPHPAGFTLLLLLNAPYSAADCSCLCLCPPAGWRA